MKRDMAYISCWCPAKLSSCFFSYLFHSSFLRDKDKILSFVSFHLPHISLTVSSLCSFLSEEDVSCILSSSCLLMLHPIRISLLISLMTDVLWQKRRPKLAVFLLCLLLPFYFILSLESRHVNTQVLWITLSFPLTLLLLELFTCTFASIYHGIHDSHKSLRYIYTLCLSSHLLLYLWCQFHLWLLSYVNYKDPLHPTL